MELLKTNEVIKKYKISRTGLWLLVKAGTVKQYNVGGVSRNLYKAEELDALIKASK